MSISRYTAPDGTTYKIEQSGPRYILVRNDGKTKEIVASGSLTAVRTALDETRGIVPAESVEVDEDPSIGPPPASWPGIEEL